MMAVDAATLAKLKQVGLLQPDYSAGTQAYLNDVNSTVGALNAQYHPDATSSGFYSAVPLGSTVSGPVGNFNRWNSEDTIKPSLSVPAADQARFMFGVTPGGSELGGENRQFVEGLSANTPIKLVDNVTGKTIYSGTGFEGALAAQKAAEALVHAGGRKANWDIYTAPAGATDPSQFKIVASDRPNQGILGQMAPVLAMLALATGAGALGLGAGGGGAGAGAAGAAGGTGAAAGGAGAAAGGAGAAAGGAAAGGAAAGGAAAAGGLAALAPEIVVPATLGGGISAGTAAGLGALGAAGGLAAGSGGGAAGGAAGGGAASGSGTTTAGAGATGAIDPITVIGNTAGSGLGGLGSLGAVGGISGLTAAQLAQYQAALNASGAAGSGSTTGATGNEIVVNAPSTTGIDAILAKAGALGLTASQIAQLQAALATGAGTGAGTGTGAAAGGAGGTGSTAGGTVGVASGGTAAGSSWLDKLIGTLKLASIAGSAFGGSGGSGSGAMWPGGGFGQKSSMFTDNTMPAPNMPGLTNPGQRNLSGTDWAHYGEGPEQSFFNAVPQPTGHARGGPVHGPLAYAGGGALHHVEGPGDGRADKIPAYLSDGEYVMDAETVALLGNGSNKAGADALDKLRVNVRKQKGGALAKGKISRNAKAPETYLGGR